MTDTTSNVSTPAAVSGFMDDREFEGALSTADAEAAIMARWTGTEGAEKATPAADVTEDGKEGTEAAAAAEDATKTGETEEAPENDAETKTDDANAETEKGAETATQTEIVKFTADGKEIEVPLADLQRLYGQEAAITRKGQEAATIRKDAEDLGARYAFMLQEMMADAEAEFEPYAQLDWHILGRQLEDDDYVALRQEAKDAEAKYLRVKGKFEGFDAEAARAARAPTQSAEAVQAANEQLAKDIPNWGAQTHKELVDFAKAQGLDIEASIDPAIFKLVHQANLYTKGKTVQTQKVAQAAKPAPSNQAPRQAEQTVQRQRDAEGRFKNSGAEKDAMAVILGRWAK